MSTLTHTQIDQCWDSKVSEYGKSRYDIARALIAADRAQREAPQPAMAEAWEALRDKGVLNGGQSIADAIRKLPHVDFTQRQAMPVADLRPDPNAHPVPAQRQAGQDAVAWIAAGDLGLMREHGRGGLVWATKQPGYAQTPLYTEAIPAPPAAQEPIAYMYHDASSAETASPLWNSTMLVFAADRKPHYRNETPLYTAAMPAPPTAQEAAQRALLVKLADYLDRLPPHPQHRAMRQRIEAVLTGPPTPLTPPAPLVGSIHTAEGRCLLAARLEGTRLTVSADQTHDSEAYAARRLQQLQKGIALELKPAPPDYPR